MGGMDKLVCPCKIGSKQEIVGAYPPVPIRAGGYTPLHSGQVGNLQFHILFT